MLRWRQLRVWSVALLSVTVTYVLAADLLPNLLLLGINSSGYLPYSDRPGPGWQSPHIPPKEELQFFWGFALLLLKGSAFYGVIYAALAWLLGVCRVPRWGLRLVATPLAFVSSGIMMEAAGWLIAISPIGIYIAAVCGSLWGLLVFPRLVPRASYLPPLPVRIIAPALIFAGGGYWLISPLLPNQALTNAKIEVVRRNDTGDAPPLNLNYIGPDLAGIFSGRGKYTSVSRLDFTTESKNHARALLIIEDPQPVAHTFVLPRTGTAVYRQSRGVWKEERGGGKPSDISVTLTSFNSTLQIHGPCCSSMSSAISPSSR